MKLVSCRKYVSAKEGVEYIKCTQNNFWMDALDFQLKGTTEKGTTASLLWRAHIIADQAVHQAATYGIKSLVPWYLSRSKGFATV